MTGKSVRPKRSSRGRATRPRSTDLPPPRIEDDRTATSVEALTRAFIDHLFYQRGRHFTDASLNDYYLALAYVVRDRMITHWIDTALESIGRGRTFVYYLSAEFLMGPQLGNNLGNLDLTEAVREALHDLGIDLETLIAHEEEPGLGNGGLGRLAACYMDSLATLGIPAVGYGIRYEFGMFDQEIRDGWQVERADRWLRWGNPWEIERPEKACKVGFGGHTESGVDGAGRLRTRWIPERRVRGVPCDTMVLGYGSHHVNILRLWKAEACESFDFAAFNSGDYAGAVEAKVATETISKVLYPNDSVSQGRRLRLEQQYFFVSCSLKDLVARHLNWGGTLANLGERNAIQLNDTHPSIAVAELMRLLLDEHDLDWDPAWDITRRTLAYTNHTLLPEALECWSVDLFGSLLPRHLEIIHEINARFLARVRAAFPGDEERVRRMSLIDEAGGRSIRMAHLATVGSHAVNGVAELHTGLLRADVLKDFHELWPDLIRNVTNGVTPRRWLLLGNPGLSALISSRIGPEWPSRTERLVELERWVDDPGFQAEWRRVRRENKLSLTRIIEERTGVVVDPESLFDVQVKRIHEYKRQHLNLLQVIARYHRIKRNPGEDVVPRTVILAGKAAPGYDMAKRIIKLATSIAGVINDDPDVAGRLKLVFLPDFNVTLGQRIYPAADLAEQISTAGKEASGTGNMKFMLNGGLTIGTLDGANVEIRRAVGDDNFFLFGLTVAEVSRMRTGGRRPLDIAEADPALREALDALVSGRFSRGDRTLFAPMFDALVHVDTYLLLADFASYLDAQAAVDAAWRDPGRWTRMSILNTARSACFSSDRSIRDYCARVWGIEMTTARPGRPDAPRGV